jgi:putative ABC transport system permease protein
MLENYIKIAWKVLLRRKFFTFVSLFGISFTIFILLVSSSILDHAISPAGPEINKSMILKADRFLAKDSLGRQSWTSSPGYTLLNKFGRTLQTPELVSIYSYTHSYFTYLNGNKLNFRYKFADPEFFQIYKFDFLHGKPFSSQDYENANQVAVISRFTAEKYFGDIDKVGEYIDVGGTDYRIVGIVENVSAVQKATSSDIWIPNTTAKEDLNSKFIGGHNMSILAYSRGDFMKIRNEWHKNLIASIEHRPKDMIRLTTFKCLLKSSEDQTASILLGNNESFETGTTDFNSIDNVYSNSSYYLFYLAIGGLMLLFMLLPSINLVNINLSRMVERNSEIGVRKAFGASRNTLVGQFVTENIILTFIGGIISLLLTAGAIYLLNDSGILMHAKLTLNYKVYIFGIIVCLVLGLISGVYPAYRMSKLHPVEALKGGEQ